MRVSFVLVLLGVATLCIWIPSWLQWEYDSGGFESICFWLCQLITMPFWLTDRALAKLNGGMDLSYGTAKSIFLVWGAIVLFVLGRRCLRGRL